MNNNENENYKNLVRKRNSLITILLASTFFIAGLGTAVYLFLAACGGGNNDSITTSSTGTGTESLSVSLTDAPSDVLTSVTLCLSEVILTKDAGTATEEIIRIPLEGPQPVDLKSYTGTLSFPLVEGFSIAPGTYTITAVLVDSPNCKVTLPSGETLPLIVEGEYNGFPALVWKDWSGFPLTVVAGQSLDLVIDYDLRRGLVDQGSTYLLLPTFRIVDASTAGSLAGTIDPTLMSGCNSPYLYLYTGLGAVPDDYDGSDALLVTSVPVDETGAFEIGFLPEGFYTAAFTCDGDLDTPLVDDEIVFTAQGMVRVNAGEPFNGFAIGTIPTSDEAGNNLSFPVIWSDYVMKPLRGVFGEPTFDGNYWYWWIDEYNAEITCNSVSVCSPPPEAETIYPQQDPLNTWQAASGAIANWTTVVDTVDWGDNLEAKSWPAIPMIRVETVLYKTLAPDSMQGFAMRYLSGQGPEELQGTNAVTYNSTEATIYSACARLTIQKLTKLREDPTLNLTWEVGANQWTGDVLDPPEFIGGVWEGGDGPGSYGAEINVSGKVIYGFNWQYPDPGDYRLTFSLDESCPAGLYTDFREGTTMLNPFGEGEVLATEEPGEEMDLGGGITGLDCTHNLTYIDVRIDESPGN